jgi:L-alanine-DL-glutamate epimerase-like enolase superfamily enzyme
LRVDSVESFPVRVKRKERLVAASFTYPDYQAVLVRVTCDGESGWGEAMTRSGPKITAQLVEEYLGPIVAGKEFDSPENVWHAIWRELRARGHTRGVEVEGLSGIEIAAQDAYARLRGSPVSNLLGPSRASEVPAYAGSLFTSRGPLKGQVEVVRSLGLMGAKVKVGFGAEKDFASLSEVRRSWEECELIADANGAYESDEALRVARKIRELDLTWFEEPVSPDDLDGYRKISREGPIPLGAGETWFVSDFSTPIEEKLIDVVEPSVSRCGGMGVAWRVSQDAARRGIKFSPMIGMNSAISLAASLQLAGAAANLFGVEYDPFGNPLLDELCPGFPQLKGGKLQVPGGNGLGLEVDMRFVRRNLAK